MPGFDVVSLPAAEHPETGDEAPDFTRPLVTDEYWRDASLSGLVGPDPVVLVFYPMNGGGKAVYTWSEIMARDWDDHATVVGVTISSPFDHMRFIADRGLPFGLFSDPANGVAADYGVIHDLDGMTGVAEPRPAFFVVGGDREVEYAWAAAEWPADPPYDEVSRVLGA